MSTTQPPRVLVIDDDPLARRVFEEIYAQAGMVAVTVPDGAAALIELSRAAFDVCLVDVVLPGRSGLELVEEIRGRIDLGRMAILGITARRDWRLMISALGAGADDFLFKPVAGEELLARTHLVLRRHRETASFWEARRSVRCEVTSLFCDVRGFTAIASTLDPEWVVEVLNGLFDRLVGDIHAHGGQVDKFLGDGLLAHFGLGQVADQPELGAVRAALAMIRSTDTYSRESLVLGGRPLTVGVGIATGPVVIAPVGAQVQRQVTAIGDSVNLASRLQAIAAEREVLICPVTHVRIAQLVRTGAGRVVELKGITGMPTIFPVLALEPSP